MTFIGITARVWEWVYRLMRRTAGPRLVEAYPADAQDTPAAVGPGNDDPESVETEPDEPPAGGPEPMETEPPESEDAPVPEEPPADGPEPMETEPPESQHAPVPDEPPADRPEPMETESGESQDKPASSEPQADAPEPKEGEPAEPRDPPTLDEPKPDHPEPMGRPSRPSPGTRQRRANPRRTNPIRRTLSRPTNRTHEQLTTCRPNDESPTKQSRTLQRGTEKQEGARGPRARSAGGVQDLATPPPGLPAGA